MSTEVQRDTVLAYAKSRGLEMGYQDWFQDQAVTGKKPIQERPAGKELFKQLKRDDVLIVAKLDRLSRSFLDFVNILESVEKRGVSLHIIDMPFKVFEPGDEITKMLIYLLGMFASYERRLISLRTKEAVRWRKSQGRAYCRWPEWGYKWAKVWNSREHKYEKVKVECPEEREIALKCLELRTQGYTFDAIREYLAYEWRVRNRKGGEFRRMEIFKMIRAAMGWVAQASAGEAYAADPENLK
jgi:DNA invertase Pin-like site-specific DNA recombinase